MPGSRIDCFLYVKKEIAFTFLLNMAWCPRVQYCGQARNETLTQSWNLNQEKSPKFFDAKLPYN